MVISQVYGGGGNVGAVLRNDFIELFNRGTAPVDLSGWSVQYASATGSSWDRTPLSGTIAPGQYYLVIEGAGNGGTTALPTPDATGAIALSATAGKIALVSSSTLLTGSNPGSSQIQDLIGYGAANTAEGRTAPESTNTTALRRNGEGCADTDNNAADFTVVTPSPRNRSTAIHLCSSTTPPLPGVSPSFSAAGVVQAASFHSGAVAPGEIVTIFGSGLGPLQLTTLQLSADRQTLTRELAGTRVLFDASPSPLLYTSAGQVSAIVPFGVAGHSSTQLQVEYNGQKSAAVSIPVAASAIGIFTANSSGRGQGAVLNQDSSINTTSRPAEPGSVITIYAAGAGQTSPPGDDGRVIGTDILPRPLQTLTATVAGFEAEVLYAGAAPGLVSGVLQVNVRLPASLSFGGTVPIALTIGQSQTPAGVFVTVNGPPPPAGTGALIEQQLTRLRQDPSTPPLPQITSDTAPLPEDWLGLLSWNIQVGGTTPGLARPPLVAAALSRILAGTYQILAAQEIPNQDDAQYLQSSLLPGGTAAWQTSFFDTSDSMDNGFWFRKNDVVLREAYPLFATTQRDSSGRLVADSAQAEHPPQVAQFEVGDFDFTLITVHLTFANGDTSESVREMRHVLDYLDWYFAQPGHDPDVMVCGDFNTPSALSGQTGRNGLTLDLILGQDPRFQVGERRFVVTVHQPTSRNPATAGGVPVSNYDHCVLSADLLEEFVQARRVETRVLTDDPRDPEQLLTSDHFPIVSIFRTRGPEVALDKKLTIRPPASLP